jgi:signal transduction histidine kinase
VRVPKRDGDYYIMSTARDTTERDAIEEQLRQAQKMEAVGQLTGGVAHDFNNLLQVVLGNLDGLRRRVDASAVPTRSEITRSVEGAIRGAERAASLTQQLLAFSRRQPLEPRAIDVNRLVTGMSELLRLTLGESISIKTNSSAGLQAATFGAAKQAASGPARGSAAASGAAWLAGGAPWRPTTPVGRSLSRGDR